MRRSKRIASLLLAVCMVWGLLPQLRLPARAAENGPMELHKVEGSGSGEGFIYYNFRETTTFTPGETYAFLDDVYGPDDAVAQLGSGAVLQATDQQNNSLKYIQRVYKGNANVATYVDVVEPGRGFDYCPKGGLYKVPDTQNPSEYRYFCWRGGAQNCGPLYAYTYDTAKIAWDDVTVYLNDPGNINSNNSADYTVKLTYDGANSITLEPRSYTVEVHENTATITITDNEGNTIQGEVVLPGVVLYRPGGLNVTGMPAVQGMQPGESVRIASRQPSRTGGYQFLYWVEEDGTRYNPGQPIDYREDGYTLTALWKDIQHPTFTCDTVEVTTGTSGETVQSVIKAALDITDNEPVSECTITVDANDDTARLKGEKQVSVTVTDKAGNKTTESVTLKVVPSPLELTAPVYSGDTLSATLLEPGSDTITEAGIVWSTISSPTTKVNNGKYEATGDMTQPDTLLSTPVELAEGVTYYARAYAVAGGVTYYGPQATVGDNIPSYGVVTIQNNNDRTFTVSRSGGTDGDQTVYYRTVNGSAVGGTHFDHQSGTVIIADGQSSAAITITEHGVNEVYGDEAATGYSNAIREYFVEIYRVDGGAVIEDNRATAKRTMTGNQTVDRNTFDEKTTNGATGETTRGDYDKDGNLGWTENKQGNQKDTISLPSPTSYVQNVAENIRFYVTFEAKEQDSGYQAVQIVPGSVTDTSIYPYDKNGGKLEGSYSVSTSVGYTALFEHGGSSKDTNWYSYHFPAGTLPNQSSLTQEAWQGTDTGDYIAFPVNTDQVTVSYGACGDNSDKWYTKNVVYHYQFSDTQEPRLLAIGDMGDSTYRMGDSFTVSLIFDEIVDRRNSTLEGKTINTSWGTATYAGGADTNVLYFTGTVPANATTTLTVNSIDSTAVIADMAGNGNGNHSGSGSVTANVDTKTPDFTLSNGSIANGVGQATISSANENTGSLRYAWSQSSTMPATGWIFLTSDELAQAKTNGYTAMTRQESGIWYLHVLGVYNGNGALAYKQTSVNFGSGSGGSGDPEIVQPPTISVSVDNSEWAKSRTITVEAENGTAEYRYGEGEWKSIDGGSITVSQNGTYAFRCVSEMEGAATASATVGKIDTAAPTASIGDMAAGTPTQKAGVYHSITLPVSYLDAQSGVKSAEYAWSSSAAAPSDDWQTVGNQPQLTYTATETEESSIYLHLRVTDQVGNAVTVTSSAYQVISPEGAKAYAPTITIGLSNKGSEDFTPWDGKNWTNETQTLEWSLSGVKNNNYVVTLPDGRTTTDSSGTILVSRNNTYTVSVVDNTYGGSNSASCTIDKIDTTAPTATYTDVPTGWQSKDVTIGFTFADQGGSGLDTARYAIVDSNTETPTDLTAFSANTGGDVTVSQDGEWYIYYEVTDGTAGTYGDGTARPANTTTGFVGPIRINKNAPTLEVTGGETGGSTLRLTIVSSESSVTVSKDGGASVPVGDSYTVTEAGTYTFTATSNAGMTTTKAVTIHSITFDSGVEKQLVVSGGTATKPADLEKDGYTFGGWYNGGSEWDFETKVTQNITLTAKWTLNTPTVTLVASMTEATYGETITLTAQVDHKISGLQYEYAWYKGETLLSGETGKILTLSDVADSGSYSVQVTITDQGGQVVTQTSGTKNITIAPRKAELEWNYTGPFSYTGNPCTVTAVVKNQVEGDTFTLTYSGNQGADVGSYQAQVIGLGNPNYTLEGGTNTTLTWEIVKGQGEASVTMEDWIYGEEASQPSPDSSTHGTGGVTYHYTGRTAGNQDYSSDAVPTDAGDYTVIATFAANDNYNAITVQDAFTIAPRPVELSWSGEPSVVYDGQEHTVTAEVENPVGEDVFHLEYSENQKTNAGSYQAEVTGLGNPNYTLEGGTNTTFAWEITKAQGEASVTMEDWTYGEEANEPSPTSGTNGTGSVTYRYTGRNETVYDSDALPTQVGEYTVTATFAPVENYEAAKAMAEFSIGKKEIYATWQGLDQVYGDGTPVKIVLDGVVSGDQVSAQVDGAVPQNAGEHPLTAILTGADAPNYIFKNDKATLTIRKKPVLFTVTDNAVQADGNAKKATVTPDESTFSGYTVEYRQEGQTVSAPKEPGRYEVWVTITDHNYRHTNGSDTMQVGDLTITQAPPTLYTVTFDGKEADGGTMPSLKTAGGSTLILPVCAFSKADYQFIGWTYDGQTYQPGDHFTMPNGDVTFKTQWEKVFRVDGTITEKTDGEDAKAANAVVSLWLGANKLNETTTDSNGDYRFDNLTPGIYNLVVTKDVRTVTKKVEIKDQNAVCNAVLPKGATNSIVEVVPGSPDIVVGQLDTVFNNPGDAVYTQNDQDTVKAGGKVEITFKAAEKQPEAAEISDDLEKIEKIGGSNLALVMDYTLEKTVTNVDGKTEKPVLITQANVLLEVRLPLPGELQGKQSYTVYRVHEEKAEALTTSPNALGEYFEVSSDKTVLILHVKCFSTYAIGYTEHSGNPGGGGGGSTPTYPPVVEQPEHGTVTISPDAPKKGDTVTITPKPEDGYQVDEVIVTDQNGKEVEVTSKGDGSYTFTQPDGKVTITVTFKEKSAVSHCPRDESCPMAPFTDADRTAWYHGGVHYCVEHGLMVGTSADTFEPNTTTTRGMIATILWRLEGSPMVDTAMNYTDAPSGSWYEEAIRWADSTGVVLGYGDGTFGPDDPITREQMAAMLWRYAGKPQAESSLADFTDGSETSQWAESAMVWAVEQGLIEGMGNAQLNPQGQATRAQAAIILMRFVEKIGK